VASTIVPADASRDESPGLGDPSVSTRLPFSLSSCPPVDPAPVHVEEHLDDVQRAQFLSGMLEGVVTPASALDGTDSGESIVGAVNDWIRTVVARPDERLQRPGAQCPFVPPALAAHSLYLTTSRVSSVEEIENVVHSHASSTFPALIERHDSDRSEFVTLVVAFTTLSVAEAAAMVELHRTRLKTFVVQRGLMLGEFSPAHFLPARHNADVNVGWAPAPILALRNMVRSDRRFLIAREEWMEAYRERFGAE
jgi:hypothetical protein